MPPRQRLTAPPSNVTGVLGQYLAEIAAVVNNTPIMSYFSGATPESTLTGLPGNLAVNVVSGTTDVRAWLKGGDPAGGPSTTGWTRLVSAPSGGSGGAGAALTATDDTNVTLTLGGSPTVALLAATSVTAGWSGTLAAARLNSSVVQSFTNDINVTATISAQVATLGWTGQLSVARGGTGLSTFTAAGGMPYATAATTLTVLAIGTANGLMQSTGSAPSWTLTPSGLTSIGATTGTFTNIGGTLTTVSQPNVTTMAALTTIGTLVDGAVPASLVTTGTFPDAYTVTGVLTLTAQPILSSLTASQAVFTDGSKGLVSNAITGTGNVVMSASPTLTGTITAAAANLSGALTALTFGGVTMSAGAVSGITTFAGTGDMLVSSAAANIYLQVNNTGANVPHFYISRQGGTVSNWDLYLPAGSTDLRFSSVSTSDAVTLTAAGGAVFKAGLSGITTLAVTTSIGVGTSAPSAGNGIAYCAGTVTNTDNIDGLLVTPAFQATSNGTYRNFGISVQATTQLVSAGVTNSGGVHGLTADAYSATSDLAGTMAVQVGIRARAGIATSATSAVVTTAYAGYFEVKNAQASATIGTSYGVYISNIEATGSMTTRYGVYATATGAATTNYAAYFNAASGTTNYALYTENGLVRLGGSTTITGSLQLTDVVKGPGSDAAFLQARNAADTNYVDLLYLSSSDVAVIPRALSVTGVLTFGAQARTKGYTVATLPAGTQGDVAYVTDALAPTFLTTLVGGGAVVTLAFYDGTNWVAA